jgi:ribosomal protein S16
MRTITINFFDTVNGGSIKNLSSFRIDSKFKLKKVRASFPPGTNRTVKIRFYISGDDSTPINALPTGTSVLGMYSPNDFIVGDDDWKEQEVNIDINEKGYFIKVSAENTDTVNHTIDASVTLDLIDDEQQ